MTILSTIAKLGRGVGPVCALTLVLAGTSAMAESAKSRAAAKQAVTQPSTPAPAPAAEGAETAVVSGFRSAHFGMTEAQVRGAIEKDFGLKGEAVKEETNLAQQTHALTVMVPDLLEGGGRALVAYVFGYKTKTLIQVGVTWSKQTDPAMTPEKLISNGSILQAHFITAGYEAQSVATNLAVPNGDLLFYGADASGHTTRLLLVGKPKEEDNNRRVLTPDVIEALSLSYAVNAKNPDIFKLPDGKF